MKNTLSPEAWSARSCRQAFTLVELLIVMLIVALLSTLGFVGTKAAMQHAKKTREIGAAKTLITAYLDYANDNNGMLLKGYDKFASGVESTEGKSITGPAAQRYPWRLAPYFDYKIDGTLLVNDNKHQIDADSFYSVSLFPALGINALYVGGYQDEDTMTMSSEVVSMMGQASTALLVFASAGHSSGGIDDTGVDGYYVIEPPNRAGPMWSDGDDSVNPEDYGNIDARYGGKAVCAFLDGAVRLLTTEELRDMRLWNQKAANADNPGYTVNSSGSGGLGGGGGRGR